LGQQTCGEYVSHGSPILHKMAHSILMHVDLDAFFASVEQVVLSIDEDIPLIIGSDPKNGRGRGIVSTCNYAARRFGVRSAMPISEAWKRCPAAPIGTAIYQRSRFHLYKKASNKVMALLSKQHDRFEQVSIDEAILDITNTCGRSLDEAIAFARETKRVINQRTQLTASIGIGPTRLLAKMASEINKPDGLIHIDPNRISDVIDGHTLREIPGIGPKAATRLAEFDLISISEARETGPDVLMEVLGDLRGGWLWRAIEGETSDEVATIRTRKSIGKETTFPWDVARPARVEEELINLCSEVQNRLNDLGAEARTIEVKLRYQGFETLAHSRTIMVATSHLRPIRDVAIRLLTDMYDTDRQVRLVGVRLSNLSAHGGRQTLLFEEE